MSDDFDKDDFSWLRDDHEDESPDEDAPDFDWQPDGGESPEQSGRLGVTGELPWMRGDRDQDMGEDRPDQLGMTGELPWMQGDEADSEAGAPSDRLGMTGELPWMQQGADPPSEEDDLSWLDDADVGTPGSTPSPEPPIQASPSDDVDLPEWLRDDMPDVPPANPPGKREDSGWLAEAVRMFGSDGEGDDAEAETPAPEIPDWLLANESTDAESEEEAAPQPLDENLPDWLKADTSGFAVQQPEVPADAEESGWEPDESREPLMDVPEWLLGLEDEAAAPAPFVDETGELSAEWLAQGERLPDHVESELTYDEWLAQQLEAEREPELDELLPDEFVDLESDEPVEVDTGVLPDWFLGMEELDTSEAPDWFLQEEGPPASAAASAEAQEPGDFFSSLEPSEGESTSPESEIDDFFAAVETGPSPDAEAAFDDFFGPDDLFGAEIPEGPTAQESVHEPDAEAPPFEFESDFGAADMQSESEEMAEEAYSLFGDTPAPEPADRWSLLDAEPDFGTLEEEGLPEPSFADFGVEFAEEPEEEPPLEVRPIPEPLDDSFFASLGLGSDEDIPESIEEAPQAAELLPEADLDIGFFDSLTPDTTDEAEAQPEDEPGFEWFEEEHPPETTEDIDWLSELPELNPAAETLMRDPLAGIDFGDDDDQSGQLAPSEMSDIDSILAAIDEQEIILPDTGDLENQDVDLETLLSDPAFADIELGEVPDQPDWLTEVGASVGAVSAAALLRQQRDRPLDELPERLRRLRERGEDIPAASPTDEGSAVLRNILPGMTDGLAAGSLEMEDGGIARSVNVTDAQQKRVNLLRSLVGQDPAARVGEVADTAALSTVPREGRRIKFDRLLVTVVVAVAVILPFFIPTLRLGNLPPVSFAVGSQQEAFFESIAALNQSDLVLVGLEYGPTAAGELDSLTTVVLQHMLRQGAVPVIVSGNPVALLRAENILESATFSDQLGRVLSAGRDYHVARYLPGAGLGLRSLVTDPATTLALNASGTATGLTGIDSLNRFVRLLVIAESPEDFRNWAEQVAPSAPQVPFLAISGRVASPLVASYLGASLDGLLVGYQDALTYDGMLGIVPLVPLDTATPTPTLTPTSTPTPEMSPTPSLTPTSAPLASGVISALSAINLREGPSGSSPVIGVLQPGTEVEVIVVEDGWVSIRLEDGTEGWVSENLITVDAEEAVTRQPTATTAPTDTPLPSATATDVPPTMSPTTASTVTTAPATGTAVPEDEDTVTPALTATPVPTEIIGRVIADTAVNIRSGPNTSFAPVGVASPGDEFVVIGRNGAGDWIQIELEGAEEAWIATFLLDISVEQVPEVETSSLMPVRGASLIFAPYRLQVDPSPTPEITPTGPAEVAGEVVSSIPYANERWYSMTLGLVAIIGIIALGALVNIGRSLLRRRR